MHCYICQQPATGQCQVCWKFYCPEHGDIRCQPCQHERDSARQSGSGARAFLLGSRDGSHAQPPNLDALPVIKVIPVVQTTEHDGIEMDLVSLDLFSEGFMARFRVRGRPSVPAGPGDAPMRSHPDFSVAITDDLGNAYEGMRRGGGGTVGNYRAGMHFSPALTGEARVLDISIDEIRWLAFEAGQRSVIQSGPWQFRVEL